MFPTEGVTGILVPLFPFGEDVPNYNFTIVKQEDDPYAHRPR